MGRTSIGPSTLESGTDSGESLWPRMVTPPASGARLGLDFGTTNTVAVLARPDGSYEQLLFDDGEAVMATLPSAVFADPSGTLLVGTEALRAGRYAPDNLLRHPKRWIGTETVSIGGRDIPVVDLVAAVLARVAAEAHATLGQPVQDVVLVVPAGWGPRRRTVLRQAAERIGWPYPRLITAPTAIATTLTIPATDTSASKVTGPDPGLGPRYESSGAGAGPAVGHLDDGWMAPGAVLVACEVGAAAAEVTVLRRDLAHAEGFEVLATRTDAGAGGLAVDDAIIDHLGAVLTAQDRGLFWRRVAEPRTPHQRGDQLVLHNHVRAAKEALAQVGQATVPLPPPLPPLLLDRNLMMSVATPIFDRIASAIRDSLTSAEVPPESIHGVFLAGAGSRLAGFEAALHRRLGMTPTLLPEPQAAAAYGALLATPPASASTADSATSPGSDLAAPGKSEVLWASLAAAGIGAAAVVMFVQALTTTTVYEATSTSNWQPVVIANRAEYAAAAILAVAALATAGLARAALPRRSHTSVGYAAAPAAWPPVVRLPGTRADRRGDGWAGQQLAGAAAVGIAVTFLLGLIAAANLRTRPEGYWGSTPVPAGALIRWTLLPALPLAMLIAAVGLLAWWQPPSRLRDWLIHLRPPVIPVFVATVGMVAVQAAYASTAWYQSLAELLDGQTRDYRAAALALAHVGGFWLGAGIALTLADTWRWRAALVPPAALIGAWVTSAQTRLWLGLAYVTAVTCWWAVRAGRLALAAARQPRSRRSGLPLPAGPAGIRGAAGATGPGVSSVSGPDTRIPYASHLPAEPPYHAVAPDDDT